MQSLSRPGASILFTGENKNERRISNVWRYRGEYVRVDQTMGKAELPEPQPSRSQGQYFEPLLDEVQAGKLLGLHPKTLQRLARREELPAVRIGRYWRFRASALNAWIDVQSTASRSRKGLNENP